MKNVIEAIEEGEPPLSERHPAGTTTDPSQALKIGKIVVPLDFSMAAMQALDLAIPLADEFDSAVHLVHAFRINDDEMTPAGDADGVLHDRASRRMNLHQQLCAVQAARPRRLRAEHCHVLPGRADHVTCEFAGMNGADLIVLSSRGQTGLSRVLLGSTAESIVRHAPCPVLVVRQEKEGEAATSYTSRLPFRKILVPVDFSKGSRHAIDYAACLARKFRARLVLFHALFPHDYLVTDRAVSDPATSQKAEFDSAEERLSEIAEQEPLRGLECEVRVYRGYPAQAICAESDRAHADLIVTSTHGWTGLKHVLLGSVAEHVVRHAACPVLTVPQPPANNA